MLILSRRVVVSRHRVEKKARVSHLFLVYYVKISAATQWIHRTGKHDGRVEREPQIA